jgi:ceramide glucosyltransferase
VSWAAVPALAAACYYLLAIVAALRWRRARPAPAGAPTPPVSILKPVRGRDPRFYDAIRSHAAQDYPEFEMLFGLSDPDDPAAEDIRRLAGEFPERRIRLLPVATTMPNVKVGVLSALAAGARHPVLVVNDSDIAVPPGYLRAVVAPLADAAAGLVTCLYRARAESRAGRWEALGIATEFAPSVLVARLLGISEFALGSTMALRAADLRRIGGFPAIGEHLADDYQLGRCVTALGLRVVFAPVVVETNLGGQSWPDAWRHQLRWARTIRVSRPGGYYGYAVTHATVWSLAALAAGAWAIAASALTVRMAAGALSAGVVGDRGALRRLWLTPFRDLGGFAVWFCGLFGRTVDWRGQKLTLSRDGRILQRKL